MPPDLLQALLNPNAPVPAWWPSGAWGAFLVFLFPLGGGIPVGVLMARDAGVGPLPTAFLYFLSDVILAFVAEPVLMAVIWISRRVEPLHRLGAILQRFAGSAGLSSNGSRGPLGLILVSFAIDPMTGRAAGAAAGHGFIPGWAFAITGDMGYFTILMASTLWLSDVLGNDRLTVGLMLGLTWVLPLFLRRLHRSSAPAAPSAGASPSRPAKGGIRLMTEPVSPVVSAVSIPTANARNRSRNGRRRTR